MLLLRCAVCSRILQYFVLQIMIDFQETETHENVAMGITPSELTNILPRELVPTSYKIPCVAHQLQLAISKFSEVPEISNLLCVARKLSAKL